MAPLPASYTRLLTPVTLLTLVTLTTVAADVDVSDHLTPDDLWRTARSLGAESRLLFGFPTGSALTLTTSLLTPVISQGPITGVLNVTWVPVAVPLDRSARQLEYIQGARSRSDDLVDIYSHLQYAVEGFGFPGQPCVLRTLCEAAGRHGDSPLLTRVLQLLLEVPDGSDDAAGAGGRLGRQLNEAKRLGTSDVAGCGTVYDQCPGSLFDLLDEANLL